MFRALNIAATGMAAQETNLEAISHNIANGNTVGFKKERIDFRSATTVRQPARPPAHHYVADGFAESHRRACRSTSRMFCPWQDHADRNH